VETYPTACIEIERKCPRLVTEICCICGIDNSAQGIIYIKLLCYVIKLNVLVQRNIIKLGDNHPIVLAVIHSMQTYPIEMIVYVYIREIPKDFK
jgi:hypothetical protein